MKSSKTNDRETVLVRGISGSLPRASFGTSTPKLPGTVQAMATDPDPSKFSHETSKLVGENSAVSPYKRQEVEWQELLAKLSTGCKI